MNSFGRLFRVSIYGESHGGGVGVIVDGMPAGIKFDIDELRADLSRRRAGGVGTTTRIEADEPHIISGIFNDYTTGAPIHVMFENTNTKSKDYSNLVTQPRPGHADYVANLKYKGYQDYRGGGHFSGRITLGLVVAGYFAKLILSNQTVTSKVLSIGDYKGDNLDEYLAKISSEGDSVGGVIELTVSNMEKCLGEPFFDSCESVISHLLFSVPAVKGVEFGIGFDGATLKGSEFNDEIIDESGKTRTNNNGGVNGGISNGNDLVVRVIVKPTPSIYKKQNTNSFSENKVTELQIHGRHDACIALRARVVLEAAVMIGLADLYLINKAYK